MGSGRVGCALASHLDALGHSVAVIDRDPEAFRRLPAGFSGQKVKGMGFDRDVLSQAGIEDAYAFAAVSSGDNSNILAARVAREVFGVEHVVARIYDAPRAELYERLGIPTICTVNWSTRAMLRQILPADANVLYSDDETGYALVRSGLHDGWIGMSLAELESRTGIRLAYVTRLGRTLPITPDLVVQESDEFVFSVPASQLDEVTRTLTLAPAKEV